MKLGIPATTSYVVANMIGTGVFTSLGFQLFDIHGTGAILLLWLLGGVVALCGALVYSELGALFPRAGGEYNFLSRILHPGLGFAAGLTSVTVGFAAPIALAALALGKYATHVLPTANPVALALVAVGLVTAVHSIGVRFGGGFQVTMSSVKVAVILLFIVAGLLAAIRGGAHFPSAPFGADVFQGAYAVSFMYVGYAYSGWNAAAYFVHEVDRPERNLPRALLLGTGLVTLLYVLLNLTFLATTPAASMAGKEDVAAVAAQSVFGPFGGTLMAGAIAVLLISTVSSMVFCGPRVLKAMGDDYPSLGILSRASGSGVPLFALFLQSALAIAMILKSDFEKLLTYTSFVLTAFTVLTAVSLVVHRVRHPEAHRPFRMPLYPVPIVVFLSFNVLVMALVGYARPRESLYGCVTVVVGALLSWLLRRGHVRAMASVLFSALAASIVSVSCTEAHAAPPRPDEVARFISGLPIEGDSPVAELTKSASWQKYSARTTSAWDKFIRPKADEMAAWRAGVAARAPAEATAVLYPFSGPDMLFPRAFFPAATTFYLFALEPVGSVPNPGAISARSLDTFGDKLLKTVRAAAHMGFYITDEMEHRLRNKDIDGTLPVILFYLVRTGATVTAIEKVTVADDGALIAEPGGPPWSGVVVRFKDGDSVEKSVTYFSGDLSDSGLVKDPAMERFLGTLPARGVVTLLKSASYLLHYTMFAKMKSVVLDKSAAIIQDDSGVPYRDLAGRGWAFETFGRFIQPLPYFKKHKQPDLARAFKTGAKPLPFRFGYGHRCNLLIATRE